MGADATYLHRLLKEQQDKIANEEFILGLILFFTHNQDSLKVVVLRTGSFHKGLVKIWMQELGDKLSCPYRTLRLIMNLGITWTRWREFIPKSHKVRYNN